MKNLKQFLLNKFPTSEYVECPIPKHHWGTIQEYTDQQTTSLQKALEERDKEVEELKEEIDRLNKNIIDMQAHIKITLAEAGDSAIEWNNFRKNASDQLKDQSQLIESLAGALRINESWSLVDILVRLVTGTDKLLIDKGYDGYDYEEIQICSEIAKKLIPDTAEALTLYYNYKNKENDTRKS